MAMLRIDARPQRLALPGQRLDLVDVRAQLQTLGAAVWRNAGRSNGSAVMRPSAPP